jgi:mRNA-degrading endonuclease toxin of MazEF toxin-antitoxin module
VIAPGDITARQDSSRELYVAVLSNSIHLAANTGRVIACPFVPGQVPDDAMAMVVPISQPEGMLLPELVQWLPSSALGEPIGSVGPAALSEAASIVTALIA